MHGSRRDSGLRRCWGTGRLLERSSEPSGSSRGTRQRALSATGGGAPSRAARVAQSDEGLRQLSVGRRAEIDLYLALALQAHPTKATARAAPPGITQSIVGIGDHLPARLEQRGLTASTLAAALTEAGAARVDAGDAVPTMVDLLVLSGLARSKGEARRTVGEGGAYLNNERIEDPDYVPADGDLIGGSWLVLRRGKKKFAGVELART